MTVVVQLRGGLGNQLFQYAAGVELSRVHGTNLQLDVGLLPPATVSLRGVRRWPEQISTFAHVGELVDSSRESPVRKRILQSLAGHERAIGDLGLDLARRRRVYAHETRDDLVAFANLSADTRINAYCGVPAYFHSSSQVVSDQVRTLSNPSEWFLAQKERIDAEQPIGIHVRWGDYLNLRHVFGTISPGYYRRGLDLITRMTGRSRPVWLFSDDPEGAAEYLSGTIAIDNVVRPQIDGVPLESLLLLSRSSGLVCANSSFSWWAAYLSESAKGSSVVFPRPMFAETGPAEPNSLLADDWIQVGRG